jgi:hypothetical protein
LLNRKAAQPSEHTEEGLQPAQPESAESVDITMSTEESTATLQETRIGEVSVSIAAEEAKLDLEKPKQEEVEAVVAPDTALAHQEAAPKPETRVGFVEETLPHEDVQQGLQPAVDVSVAPTELSLDLALVQSAEKALTQADTQATLLPIETTADYSLELPTEQQQPEDVSAEALINVAKQQPNLEMQAAEQIETLKETATEGLHAPVGEVLKPEEAVEMKPTAESKPKEVTMIGEQLHEQQPVTAKEISPEKEAVVAIAETPITTEEASMHEVSVLTDVRREEVPQEVDLTMSLQPEQAPTEDVVDLTMSLQPEQAPTEDVVDLTMSLQPEIEAESVESVELSLHTLQQVPTEVLADVDLTLQQPGIIGMLSLVLLSMVNNLATYPRQPALRCY